MKHLYHILLAWCLLALAACQPDSPTRPNGYDVFGVDFSRYQQDIDFDTLAAQEVKFAFVKATEGRGYTDPSFTTNWRELTRVGIRRGAYHFYLPTIPARQQAAHFTSKVKLEAGDLPPVLDFELTDNRTRDEIVSELSQWLDVVEKFYGIRPIIYTNYKLYNKFIAGTFDTYPIWIAKYGTKEPMFGTSRQWHFWQYSNKGSLKGIKGNLDVNVFSGTLTELDKLCFSMPKDTVVAEPLPDRLGRPKVKSSNP